MGEPNQPDWCPNKMRLRQTHTGGQPCEDMEDRGPRGSATLWHLISDFQPSFCCFRHAVCGELVIRYSSSNTVIQRLTRNFSLREYTVSSFPKTQQPWSRRKTHSWVIIESLRAENVFPWQSSYGTVERFKPACTVINCNLSAELGKDA